MDTINWGGKKIARVSSPGVLAVRRIYCVNSTPICVHSRSQWPRGLRRRSWPLACCDRGFESHRGHGCLSVVCVVCCQVEVSATD